MLFMRRRFFVSCSCDPCSPPTLKSCGLWQVAQKTSPFSGLRGNPIPLSACIFCIFSRTSADGVTRCIQLSVALGDPKVMLFGCGRTLWQPRQVSLRSCCILNSTTSCPEASVSGRLVWQSWQVGRGGNPVTPICGSSFSYSFDS